MIVLTANEKKMLRHLATTKQDHSINQLASALKITPNGAYKILKKLEVEKIIEAKQIANLKSYKLNFSNEKTENVLALAFMGEAHQKRVEERIKDFQKLKDVTTVCLFFGSYITEKQKPNDLDFLIVMEKNQFKNYKKVLNDVRDITPIKIHDVIQTEEDLINNLNSGDLLIITTIKEGVVIWGWNTLVKVIKQWQMIN